MYQNHYEDIEGSLPNFIPMVESHSINDIHLVSEKHRNKTIGLVLLDSGELLSFVMYNTVLELDTDQIVKNKTNQLENVNDSS